MTFFSIIIVLSSLALCGHASPTIRNSWALLPRGLNNSGVLASVPPSDTDYSKATCGTTDASHSTTQRWFDSDAPGAWKYAIDRWNQGPSRPDGDNLPFVEYISHQFQGPQNLDCDRFGDDSGCVQSLGRCGDMHGASGDVDVPAGYLILNSFVRVHNVCLLSCI
jgi:hypothetical protein